MRPISVCGRAQSPEQVIARAGRQPKLCFGRPARVGMCVLNAAQYNSSGDYRLTPMLRLVFDWWEVYWRDCPPRRLDVKPPERRPTLIYTDGWQAEAEVPCQLGAGADLSLPCFEFFGLLIPDDVVSRWSCGGSKAMLVNSAEHFPVLLARTTWSHYLRNSRVLHVVDNDGVRDSSIRGYSPVEGCGLLIGASALAEVKLSMRTWFSRVPSESNIADGPSRLDFEELLARGSKAQPVFPSCWNQTEGKLPSYGLR